MALHSFIRNRQVSITADPALGPFDVDSRAFTPEAMDEYEAYLAETAVAALAA